MSFLYGSVMFSLTHLRKKKKRSECVKHFEKHRHLDKCVCFWKIERLWNWPGEKMLCSGKFSCCAIGLSPPCCFLTQLCVCTGECTQKSGNVFLVLFELRRFSEPDEN